MKGLEKYLMIYYGEVHIKLSSRGFHSTSLSTYDLSTLYTTLSHNLIKEKPLDWTEKTFKRESTLYFACNNRKAFSLLLSKDDTFISFK